MVDAAISLPQPFDNAEQVVEQDSFMREVKEKASRLRQYEGYDWTRELIEEDTARAKFFFNFLRRASSQVAARAGLVQRSAPILDEIASVILSEIATAVHEFRPGFSRGLVSKSWGFEAYLQNYTVKTATHEFRKTISSPSPPRGSSLSRISIDGNEFSQEMGNLWTLEKDYPEKFATFPQTMPLMAEKDCSNLIVESIKESISGTPEAEVYLLHAVEGKTIRETSAVLSLSRGKCHRMAERAAQKVWSTLDLKLRASGVI